MSNGYKHQHETQDVEPVAAPKRRRTPSAGVSPPADGAGPSGRRGSDAAEGGGGDERNVVELETDADGMDDGYRCAAWRCSLGQAALRCGEHDTLLRAHSCSKAAAEKQQISSVP